MGDVLPEPFGTSGVRSVGRRFRARSEAMPTTPNIPGSELIPPKPKPPWRTVVREALARLGGQASLQALYVEIDNEYQATSRWRHWKAKVRQQVQLDPEIEHVAYGVWRLKSAGLPTDASDSAAPSG